MYGYLSNPKLASELGVGKIKGQFTLVSGVTAPDNSTVRLEFSSPLTYWKNVLVYWYLIRVPDLSDWAFQKHLPIGTGPFKMTHYTQGLSATFEANTDYYRPTEPRLDGYSFIMYAAAPSELPNLESGYINGGLIASYADAKTLSDSSRYATQKAPLGCNYVLVNFVNSNLALKKAAVRQALAYSMDRKEYAAVAYSGFEIPTCTVWYAPATIAYSKSALDAYPFDLAKAASLLKSAGVVDLALTLAIDISDPNFESMAEIWQSDLQKIGVALTIKPVADAVWADLGSGVDTKGIDLISYDCGRCYQDPAILIGANPQFSGGSANPVGYRNAELEQLIVRGPGIVNPAKRRANYQQISQMLLSECPVLPTVSLTYIFGWEKKVSGYSADLIAGLRLADTTI
jgi:peptide/nickel transport system substrate-binding protein/glutathione transport system substrate-binding protein